MVKTGSDINLTCKIMQGPHELGNIFWYKGAYASCVMFFYSSHDISNNSICQKTFYITRSLSLLVPLLGSEMLDNKHENEIDSSLARIRVEDDWSDGLTSR